MLHMLMDKWKEHKMDPTSKAALAWSHKREEGHKRLSKEIWGAQRGLHKSRSLAFDVMQGRGGLWDLSRRARALGISASEGLG